MSPAQTELLNTALEAFERASKDRRDPFHMPMLANTDERGQPLLRTIVIREFDASTRRLVFHSDARAPKIAQFQRDPRAALTAYDHPRQLQVRLLGRITVHISDEQSARRWASMQPMSKIGYHEPRDSGIPLNEPFANAVGLLDDACAFAHMAVLEFSFDSIEVLRLQHQGHARLRVHFAETAQAQWLTP